MVITDKYKATPMKSRARNPTNLPDSKHINRSLRARYRLSFQIASLSRENFVISYVPSMIRDPTHSAPGNRVNRKSSSLSTGLPSSKSNSGIQNNKTNTSMAVRPMLNYERQRGIYLPVHYQFLRRSTGGRTAQQC